MKNKAINYVVRILSLIMFFSCGYVLNGISVVSKQQYSVVQYDIAHLIIMFLMGLICGYAVLREISISHKKKKVIVILLCVFAFLSVAQFFVLFFPFGVTAFTILKACQPVSIVFTAILLLTLLFNKAKL